MNDPGFTVFGRIFEGWSTVQLISEKMSLDGYLAKTDKDKAFLFTGTRTVTRKVPKKAELLSVLEGIHDDIDTQYSVVVFSKTYCPYCKRVKELLETMGAQLHVVELDLLPSTQGPLSQDALELMTGQRTVPNVFVNGISIGGCDATEQLYDSGKLVEMVKPTGALGKSTILKLITSHPVVIFSKTFCPYCKQAKATLSDMGSAPIIVELDERSEDGGAIQYYLQQLTGRKTVPNVFVGGKTIGGGDDVEKLKQSGELMLLLQTAGAL